MIEGDGEGKGKKNGEGRGREREGRDRWLFKVIPHLDRSFCTSCQRHGNSLGL